MRTLLHKEGRLRETFRATVDRVSAAWRPPAPPIPAGAGSHVVLERVRLAYGKRRIFDSLSCAFPPGRISVILGGSGSGKSTILRLIGGLIRPQAGRVLVDGEDVTRMSERGLKVMRYKLGMLFQGGALLDSYNVFDNLALPLREQNHLSQREIINTVNSTLVAVGVTDADELLPGQLSGGMLRRVALGRAIIRKPLILLCDEPFSGLDPIGIKRIEALLVAINRQFGMTIIVVSHHIPSTLRMAERVLLLLEGRTVQGSPGQLRHGTDAEAADFLNEGMDEAYVPENL
jgi:phospholipid/cholesterol/gamma-HCH transport system ATP-binding protein